MPTPRQGIDGHADRKGIDGRPEDAASRAKQHHRRTRQAVEPRSDHGCSQQQVERHRLLTHTIGSATDGKHEHENRDEGQLVAAQFVHEGRDAGVQGTGLGDDAEKAA